MSSPFVGGYERDLVRNYREIRKRLCHPPACGEKVASAPRMAFARPSAEYVAGWSALIKLIRSCAREVFDAAAANVVVESSGAEDGFFSAECRGLGQIIIADVCRRHKISRDELLFQNRSPCLIAPRFEAMYAMRCQPVMSIHDAARFLNRDRATVINGAKKHARRNTLPQSSVVRSEGVAYVVRR